MARKKRRKTRIWPWFIGGLILLGIFGQEPDIETPIAPKTVTTTPPAKTNTRLSVVEQTVAPVAKVSIPLPKPKPVQPNAVKKIPKLVSVEPASTPPVKKKITPVLLVQYVDASRLNVRSGPSKKDKTVWTLKRDQKVIVIGRDGVWAQVKGDRYEGWVHSGFLTPNKSKPKTTLASRTPPAKPKVPKLTNAAIAKILIKRSFAYYSGNCPCPYNRTASGRRCGKRSAYSRPGGASPMCYRRDISAAMIKEYRDRQ